MQQHLVAGTKYFAPTPEWNTERSADHLWSVIRQEKKEAATRLG
jgi:hypothetical protein